MVTVLIFSFNRHKILEKSLEYWASTGIDVIVADATETPLQTTLPANVTYLHRPLLSIKERVDIMLAQASTPYVALCADDDFTAYRGLLACVDFLRKNEDYSAAQGLYLRFWKEAARHGVAWLWDYQYARKYSFEEAAAVDRLKHAMQPPVMHYCYSVMKKHVLNNCLRLMDGVEEEPITTFELSFIPGLMLQGKYKTLPLFYQARKRDVIPRWSEEKSFSAWYENHKKNGILRWKDNIIDMYRDRYPGLSCEEFRSSLDQCFKKYYAYTKHKKTASANSTNSSSVKNFLRPIIYPFYSIIRNIIGTLKMFGIKYKNYINFNQDWMKIKKTVEKSDG